MSDENLFFSHLMKRISNIENDISFLKLTEKFSKKVQRDLYLELIDKIINSKIKAQLYLQIDGVRTAKEIEEYLSTFTSINFSREVKPLKENELIKTVGKVGKSAIYGKSELEKILDISEHLMKKEGLNSDSTEKVRN